MDTPKLQDILLQFESIRGDYLFSPYGNGLIHQTYLAKGTTESYIIQRINTDVFPKPSDIMSNIEKAMEVLKSPDYFVPAFLQKKDGSSFLFQDESGYWRAMKYIANSTTYAEPHTPGMAYEAGLILGRFHSLMASAKSEEFRVIIPGFHELENHWGKLQNILESQNSGMKNADEAILSAEIINEYILQNQPKECRLRICHNDAKLDNILFDKSTGLGLGLIDLDTLMPGYFYFDFGDTIRDIGFYGSEKNPSTYPEIRLDFIKSMFSGLMNSGLVLDESEQQSLTYGAVLMPFLHGIRALTDHIGGNRYYKVTTPNQNLERATYLLQVAEESIRSLDQITELISN